MIERREEDEKKYERMTGRKGEEERKKEYRGKE